MPATAAPAADPSPGEAKPLLTREEAIEIAKQAIAGKVTPAETSTLEVEVTPTTIVVEWRTHLPPHTRGPDYDARVTIDRVSREVTELLVGS